MSHYRAAVRLDHCSAHALHLGPGDKESADHPTDRQIAADARRYFPGAFETPESA